jgi:RNase P subunit RPR2
VKSEVIAMEIKTKGCKKCEEAKKGFILLNKVGFKNVSVMCNYCETIWKLEDEFDLGDRE